MDWRSFRLDEIEQHELDKIQTRLDKIGEEQGLQELFGDKQRIIIPFVEDQSLKEIIEGITDYFKKTKGGLKNDDVVVNFDWKNKEVKITWKNPNKGKEVKDKKTGNITTAPELLSQNMSIAKAAKKAGLGKKSLDWWSYFANDENVPPDKRDELVKNAEKYKIIVSRHPIDTYRMSDFGNIQSCHAPGREYFKCARQEAIDGGGIAYLVNGDELDGVDLDGDEIFEDENRGIYSTPKNRLVNEPLSRVRVRRYSSKFPDKETDENFDFAVPDDRAYGLKNPAFIDRVTDWLREQQKDLIERNGGRKNFRIENFSLRGGDYRDSSDSALFNTFFNDSMDRGNTVWKWEGQEFGEDIAEQFRRELEEINEEFNGTRENGWNGILKHSYAGYYEYDDYEPFEYSMDGGVNIELKISLKKIPDSKDIAIYRFHKDETLVETLVDYLNHHGYYFSRESHDVDYNDKILQIRLSIDTESDDYSNHRDNDGLHPDAFREFCEYVENDFDKHYDEIAALVKNWLVFNGYTGFNPAMDVEEKIKSEQIRFSNFEYHKPEKSSGKWDRENSNILFYLLASDSILFTDKHLMSLGKFDKNRPYNYSFSLMEKMIKKMFMGVMKSKSASLSQQLNLPFDPKFYNVPDKDDPNPTDKKEDPRQLWFKFSGGDIDPLMKDRYTMHSQGVPQISVGYTHRNSGVAIKVDVWYDFSIDDSEETIKAAIQNISVYDRNWRDLMDQVQRIMDRAAYVKKFGRGNYQTYNQNLQAQLLGAKPKMGPTNNPFKHDYEDDDDIGFFTHRGTGELPYRDYRDYLDARSEKLRKDYEAGAFSRKKK